MCSCEVITHEMPLSCIVNSTIIIFTSQDLSLNRQYNVTVNVQNSRLVTSSQIRISEFKLLAISMIMLSSYLIGTHDIQQTTVDALPLNAINFRASYVENAAASGALVVFLYSNDDTDVALNRSMYFVLEHVQSISWNLLRNITNGTHRVLTYDVESNGEPELGEIYPATSHIVDINGEGKAILSTLVGAHSSVACSAHNIEQFNFLVSLL